MIEAVLRSIRLDTVELPDEFFPAYLPVALIDSVVRSAVEYDPHTVRSTERYCDRFGIERTRAERLETPPADEQETLADLVKRFEELGVDRMADEVFSGRQGAPGAESVLKAAMALRQLGVEVLQDVPARSPDAIEDALQSSGEAGESAGRRLMMYAGDDDFVRGDIHGLRGQAVSERPARAPAPTWRAFDMDVEIDATRDGPDRAVPGKALAVLAAMRW